MISVEEARALVRERSRPLEGADSIALTTALGRVLAEPVRALRDDPPFHRAMMDGFALRAGDTRGAPRMLDVTGRVAAGDEDLPAIEAGCAAWINTGAPIPPGADAVVPVEQTRGEVEVLVEVEPWAHVQRRGRLVREGDVVAEGLLTPERVAVCAAQGADSVRVRPLPRVAVLATGAELSRAPTRHQIRNSNGPMLCALLSGYALTDLGVADDEPAALTRALERGLEADVLVTTGGVSRGDLDLVPPVLETLGVRTVFHGVALQPGKPLLFGEHLGGVVFALPGNPASALVCTDLFVLPHLAGRAGRGFDAVVDETRGRLTGPIRASPQRRRVFPCVRRGNSVDPLPWRSSADLYTLPRANAYMAIEPGCDAEAGDEVRCLVPERFAARILPA